MSDQTTLRRYVREAMRDGRLPRRSAARMWGGKGTGGECSVCGERRRSDQAELELEFSPEHGAHAVKSVLVHVACFDAWQQERQRSGPTLSRPMRLGTILVSENDASSGRESA
jgi:hypothetical protein